MKLTFHFLELSVHAAEIPVEHHVWNECECECICEWGDMCCYGEHVLLLLERRGVVRWARVAPEGQVWARALRM